MGNGNAVLKSPSKLKEKFKSKPPKPALSYIGQPKVRVEMSSTRIHGCNATEFLAWVRQQERR